MYHIIIFRVSSHPCWLMDYAEFLQVRPVSKSRRFEIVVQ